MGGGAWGSTAAAAVVTRSVEEVRHLPREDGGHGIAAMRVSQFIRSLAAWDRMELRDLCTGPLQELIASCTFPGTSSATSASWIASRLKENAQSAGKRYR